MAGLTIIAERGECTSDAAKALEDLGQRDEAARIQAVASAWPDGLRTVIARSGDGRVVGHLAARVVPMMVAGKSCSFGASFGAFVHPDHRLGGRHTLFVEMMSVFAEAHESRDDLMLVYGIWSEPEFWFLRRICGYQPISTGLTFALEAPEPPPAEVDRAAPDVVDLESRLDWDWSQRDGVRPCSTPWTPRRCLWRSTAGTRVLRVRGLVEGRRVVGYGVVEDEGGVPVITALEVPDGEGVRVRALLEALTDGGREPTRITLFNADRFRLNVLYEAGFRTLRSTDPVLAARWTARNLKQTWLHAHWALTGGDVHRAAVLPVVVDELIVHPPLAGTRPGDRSGE